MDLKDLILSKGDPAQRKLVPAPCQELPDLDGQVFVTELTEREFMDYVQDLPSNPEQDKLQVTRFLVLALRDKDGNRIFKTDIIEMSKLAALPMRVIRRWDRIAQSLNYMGDVAADMEKKSDAGASTTS